MTAERGPEEKTGLTLLRAQAVWAHFLAYANSRASAPASHQRSWPR
jgi:hypothetical protein